MLVATTMNNQLYAITAETSRAELVQLKGNISFYCPQCKYPLQLKIGRIRTPHFAHVQKTACDHYFSEGESETHIVGKQQLYSFFKKHVEHVQLESVIPALQQRPDLLVLKNGRKFAIEFQCSRIPYELFMARTTGYLRHDIVPVWLLKSKNYVPSPAQKISLNHFEQLFIQTYNGRPFLLTYNPLTKKFIYFNHLLHLFKNSYIASIQAVPLEQQSFPFFVPNKMNEAQFEKQWFLYQQYRQNFLKKRLQYSRDGVQDLFLRAIYEMRLSREQLPLFIGLPIGQTVSIPLFSAEWQMLLFYFLHVYNITLQQFSTHNIPHFLTWAKIPCSPDVIATVKSYLQMLHVLQVEHVHSNVQPSILFQYLCGEFVAID